MARWTFEALIALALLAGQSAGLAAAEQNEPKQTGPVALIIQYKCAPAQRVKFRRALAGAGLRQFSQWQADGVLADYRLLFSRYVDTNSWDALGLLTFKQYSDVARWRKIEETMPAGLPADSMALTSSVETYPADLIRQASSTESARQPVYLVIPYTYSVTTPAYLKYVDEYVAPQFDGWMREGILAGYRLYLQRYTAARPWDMLIFLKYKDDESFGQREKIVAKVREQLQGDRVWKAASDNKQNVRVEKEAVIADELSPVR